DRNPQSLLPRNEREKPGAVLPPLQARSAACAFRERIGTCRTWRPAEFPGPAHCRRNSGNLHRLPQIERNPETMTMLIDLRDVTFGHGAIPLFRDFRLNIEE